MAAVLRSGGNGNIAGSKPLPPVPSPKVRGVRPLTDDEQTGIATKIQTYLEARVDLAVAEKEKARLAAKKAELEAQERALEATSKSLGEQSKVLGEQSKVLGEQSKVLGEQSKASDERIKENRREAVRTILSQKVLGVEKSVLLQTFKQSDLDKITCELQKKKCLITDTPGVDDVILPILKTKNITTVNLSLFKDEITPKAVIAFFNGLPETKVSTVVLGKTLTAEEVTAKQLVEQTLAKLGRQLIVTVKAASAAS